MSISYGFMIKLNAIFSRKNIEKIIHQGRHIGLAYLELENINNEIHHLNSVVEKILYNKEHPKETDIYGTELMFQALEVRYQDILMSILFREEDNNLLRIHIMTSNCTRWTQSINNYDTDVQRYVQFINDFMKGFEIIELYYYTDGYEEDLIPYIKLPSR